MDLVVHEVREVGRFTPSAIDVLRHIDHLKYCVHRKKYTYINLKRPKTTPHIFNKGYDQFSGSHDFMSSLAVTKKLVASRVFLIRILRDISDTSFSRTTNEKLLNVFHVSILTV